MIELRSKTKIDNMKKALFKSKSLIEGLSFDVDELSDMPEEMLSVSTVNHTLFADPAGNNALEAYLTDKIFVRIKFVEVFPCVTVVYYETFQHILSLLLNFLDRSEIMGPDRWGNDSFDRGFPFLLHI